MSKTASARKPRLRRAGLLVLKVVVVLSAAMVLAGCDHRYVSVSYASPYHEIRRADYNVDHTRVIVVQQREPYRYDGRDRHHRWPAPRHDGRRPAPRHDGRWPVPRPHSRR